LVEDIVLEVKNITKLFPGVRALSDFSLVLRRGEVHGIVGENGAGKSTLMNIISGNMRPNSGEIFVDGNAVEFNNSRDAQRHGISIVHQEPMNCPDVRVSENIFMNTLETQKGFLLDYKKLSADAADLLKKFGVRIGTAQKMKNLNVSAQQIVEIVKAISANSKIVIFDEPTASLTKEEEERLFKIIQDLKAHNISMLYISHRMEEIFRNCDRVTILKDGAFVDTLDVAATDRNTIINKMVGRNLSDFYPPKGARIGDVFFEAKDFANGKDFHNVSFDLRRGEILGVSGLMGSGRTEICRAVCGLDYRQSGNVRIDGNEVKIESYRDALKNGVVYLTEDRKTQGLMLNMSVMLNISILNLDKLSIGVLMSDMIEREQARRLCGEMNVKATGLGQKVGTLSGGNQQKVLIAKSLSIEPKIVFMDEPTRGVDIGAKVEIYHKLRELADRGVGVVMVSSELSEIIGMCDRVIVVHEGRINGELRSEEISEALIMQKASGY
jgi:ribose transport system ATP-binding protein